MIIVGVDEVGRGCLVGNVVAGAVILPDDFYLPRLTDSKKLSAKKREILYAQITKQCQWALGESSASEIDNINILQATMLAMKRAVEALNVQFDQVLVDGNCCPELNNCTAIVKGDLIEPSAKKKRNYRPRKKLELQKSLKFLKLKKQNCVRNSTSI
jgi:ribonuclease HII